MKYFIAHRKFFIEILSKCSLIKHALEFMTGEQIHEIHTVKPTSTSTDSEHDGNKSSRLYVTLGECNFLSEISIDRRPFSWVQKQLTSLVTEEINKKAFQ